MEKTFGLTELIKETLEKEVKNSKIKELVMKILEAYLKDGKKAVEELVHKLFEEAVKHAEKSRT